MGVAPTKTAVAIFFLVATFVVGQGENYFSGFRNAGQVNKAWNAYLNLQKPESVMRTDDAVQQFLKSGGPQGGMTPDQQSGALRSTYQNEGLSLFTSSLGNAKLLNQRLRQAVTPGSTVIAPPTVPIPGSPQAGRPMAPSQLQLDLGMKNVGTFFKDMVNNDQMWKDFIDQPNLLLDRERRELAQPHRHNRHSDGPSVFVGNPLMDSFLQLPADTAPLLNPNPNPPSTASSPSFASLPSLPSLPSNTGSVLMFHLLPYLLRSTYQAYHDLNEEEQIKIFGADYVNKKKKKAEESKISRTSSTGVLPKEHYEGYDMDYYQQMQNSKPISLWWNYKAKTPPPWFTNNAPPPRPHFMRSPVNIPKPPFKSPFNKHMFSTGYFQQKPKPWPLVHHPMVPGQQPGEGSMKCPCPANPMLMCDCNSLEYEQNSEDLASDQAKKKADSSDDEPWEKLEQDIVDNVIKYPNLETWLAILSRKR